MKKYKNYKKYKRRKYSYIDCHLNYPLKYELYCYTVDDFSKGSLLHNIRIFPSFIFFIIFIFFHIV